MVVVVVEEEVTMVVGTEVWVGETETGVDVAKGLHEPEIGMDEASEAGIVISSASEDGSPVTMTVHGKDTMRESEGEIRSGGGTETEVETMDMTGSEGMAVMMAVMTREDECNVIKLID